MRNSVTQEYDYGCGIACFAFATETSYEQAAEYLGLRQANSNRFWVKDFRQALNSRGLSYISKHIKPAHRSMIYQEGVIVLLRRSKRYPTGHYLIRHEGQWMDPWINLAKDKDIFNARSGFRKRLPGSPMYALLPS